MDRAKAVYVPVGKTGENKFSHIEVEIGDRVWVSPIKFMRVSECAVLNELLAASVKDYVKRLNQAML